MRPVRTSSRFAAYGGMEGETVEVEDLEVSVSLHDAWSRLICAGWLPAGPCVRLERCAGLRTSVARFPL